MDRLIHEPVDYNYTSQGKEKPQFSPVTKRISMGILNEELFTFLLL